MYKYMLFFCKAHSQVWSTGYTHIYTQLWVQHEELGDHLPTFSRQHHRSGLSFLGSIAQAVRALDESP